jgi:hypothetical protein
MKGIAMDKIRTAKIAVNFVVGAGVSKIVAGIIHNNTNPERVTDKVAIAGAAVVIGSMAADATSSYTDTKIDEIVEWWNENVKPKLTKES